MLLSNVALGREFQSPAGRAARAEMLGIVAVKTEGFKVSGVERDFRVCDIGGGYARLMVCYVGGLAATLAYVPIGVRPTLLTERCLICTDFLGF